MKKLLALLIISFTIACSGPTEKENVVAEYPSLIGIWSGEGRFMDVTLDKEVGIVWLEFEIFDDNSVTGTLGDASIIETRLFITDFGFEISGRLDAKVKNSHDLDKDHVFILIVVPEDQTADFNSSEANFQLKGNSIFDFDMKVGGVNLVKKY